MLLEIELPPSSVHRLQRLKRITESSSYAVVIGNSLQLYEALVDEAEKGNQFLLRDPEGKVTDLHIFGKREETEQESQEPAAFGNAHTWT